MSSKLDRYLDGASQAFNRLCEEKGKDPETLTDAEIEQIATEAADFIGRARNLSKPVVGRVRNRLIGYCNA